MLGQQATWLDLIPGARQGVSYLMGQVANFQRLPSRFTQIETAAIAAKRVAETRGSLGAATKLALAMQANSKLREQWTGTSGRLADVLEGLRTTGLAATPVELGVLAARVATEVGALLNGAKIVEGQVYSAASSVMSPSEVAALKVAAPGGGTSIGGASSFAKYAIFGGLLYVGVMLAGKKRRTSKSKR